MELFINPSEVNIPVEQIQKDLALLCSRKKKGQFVMSRRNKIACYRRKSFILTDLNFKPLLIYNDTSPILFCGISDNERFAVFQTEGTNGKTAFTILDLLRKKLVRKREYVFGEGGITHLFVDEVRHTFTIYRGEEKEILTFFFKQQPDLSAKRVSSQLGISEKRLRELEEKAREEVYSDDTWEKELERKNRAKAGIK